MRYSRLCGEGGLGCRLAKLASDCDGLLIASDNYIQDAFRVNETHHIWMAICDGRMERLHTPICLPLLSKTSHLVLRGTVFAHKEYKKYLPLVHISIRFPAMVTTFPLCSRCQSRSYPRCNLEVIE